MNLKVLFTVHVNFTVYNVKQWNRIHISGPKLRQLLKSIRYNFFNAAVAIGYFSLLLPVYIYFSSKFVLIFLY